MNTKLLVLFSIKYSWGNVMNLYDYAFQIAVSIIISYILIYISSLLITRLKNSSVRVLNPTEYFPPEQVKTLKQVFYLVLIFAILFLITNFFFDNGIIKTNSSELYGFNAVLDIILATYFANVIYKDKSKKSHILVFFLLPVASISYLIFGSSYIEFWDILRIPVLLYLIKLLYGRFKEFTDEHSLGFSIILLFSIIFFSVVSTIIFEDRSPLDAIIMVSNAFTSNGYAILGNTPGGKFNSLILVWSGYIISGAATATLTAAILLRHNKHQLESYDKKMNEIQSTIDNEMDEIKSTLDELKERLEKDE